MFALSAAMSGHMQTGRLTVTCVSAVATLMKNKVMQMVNLEKAVAWLEEMKEESIDAAKKLKNKVDQETLDDFEQTAANCRTLLDALRWVPVTERLPDEGVPVLVTYIGYNTKKAHSDGIAKWSIEANSHNGGWLWNYEDTSVAVEITHWRPLPAPPEGSKT